jgi:hypothetical protein
MDPSRASDSGGLYSWQQDDNNWGCTLTDRDVDVPYGLVTCNDLGIGHLLRGSTYATAFPCLSSEEEPLRSFGPAS